MQAINELIHPTAERVVIAGLTRGDVSLAIELGQAVEHTDFATPLYSVICEAVSRVVMGVEPLDTEAIVAQAREIVRERKAKVNVTHEFVSGLQGEDIARALPYAHTVKRYAWLRQAQDFSQWITSQLDARPDPDELFAAAQERIQHLQPPTANQRFVYGWDTINTYQDLLMERARLAKKGEAKRFDWPWAAWNRYIRPLRPSLVGTIVAPDGMGKSSYLEMIAEYWATFSHVVFVHLENDLDYTRDRRMCRHSRLPLEVIEDGTYTPEQWRTLQDANKNIAQTFGANLHYLDAAGCTMPEIIAELSTRQQAGYCDAVVLDYLNKVRPTRGQARLYGENQFGRQADDMEQLKTFAVKHHVPVLTASQMNKQGQEAGRQTRRNIRGSGEISEKSQLVVILTREILENDLKDKQTGRILQEKGEYSPVVHVRVDKQNRGKTGEFEQVYDGAHFSIKDKSYVQA